MLILYFRATPCAGYVVFLCAGVPGYSGGSGFSGNSGGAGLPEMPGVPVYPGLPPRERMMLCRRAISFFSPSFSCERFSIISFWLLR